MKKWLDATGIREAPVLTNRLCGLAFESMALYTTERPGVNVYIWRDDALRSPWMPGSSSSLGLIIFFHAAFKQPAHAEQVRMNKVLTTGPATRQSLDSLLARMTIDEKLGQLTLFVGEWSDIGPRISEGGEQEILDGKVGTFYGIYGAEYTREMQRIAVEESRLGIPLLFAHDIIHGFRTIFPVPLAQASSFDPDLIEEAARIAAIEMSAHGVHWTFAPMMDVSREPRWGRVVEGAGEDPFLASSVAAAQVHGYQGDDLAADNTVLATAKHFVGYGDPEGGRDYNTVDIGARMLREVYLPPFKAAVDAGVGAVMAAFNDVDDVPMHAHNRLINDLLRETWGFEGIVVSDYTGIRELVTHGVAADDVEAGLIALEAGIDVDLVSGIYLKLKHAIESGRLAERVVDDAVRRILTAKFRLGLFDDPYRYCDAAREAGDTLTASHRDTARRLARESIVLLKNDGGVLPLSSETRKIAVIGPLADDAASCLGGWSGTGRAEDVVTVLQGIRQALPDAEIRYEQGANWNDDDVTGIDAAVEAAREADAVILVIGEHRSLSAEASSRASLDLPGAQLELVQALHATGKPVVAVLTNGRPLAVSWMADHVPAVLETWFLGVETGTAVADVLFGHYNPGGKLPITFPRSAGQIPIYYNHKNTGRPPRGDEKFTSKYVDLPWTPLYPFGHGLSYTSFAYSVPRTSADRIGRDDTVAVEVDVTNTGSRSGDEVVQLYVRDEVASVSRPVKQLRGFRRIRLEPGETRTVRFTLTSDDLALYNRDMDFVVEPGLFTVYVGTSSTDVQKVRFEVVDE